MKHKSQYFINRYRLRFWNFNIMINYSSYGYYETLFYSIQKIIRTEIYSFYNNCRLNSLLKWLWYTCQLLNSARFSLITVINVKKLFFNYKIKKKTSLTQLKMFNFNSISVIVFVRECPLNILIYTQYAISTNTNINYVY